MNNPSPKVIREIVNNLFQDADTQGLIDTDAANATCSLYTKKLMDLISATQQEERKRTIKEVIKGMPEELGFNGYDKHMHSYVHENRGNCEICGLSWKKAGQYELYNNGILHVKKYLKGLRSSINGEGKSK